MSTDIKKLEDVASQVRRDIVRMVHGVGNGHPGGALGCADYFVALYFHFMKHDAKNFTMDAKGEDLCFLSNGHISAVWYSTLARAGYFDPKELATHRKLDSRLQGHPTPHEGLEGIRMASGSLGQGLSNAIGAAQTKKLNNDKSVTYILMGDGEQQEGQVWEAAMYAAHHKVDNLIATIDYNGAQIDGPVDEVMALLDLKAKYESFGWTVLSLKEGNDMAKIVETYEKANSLVGQGKPIMVLMEAEMGFPIDFMVGTHKWHGVAPNDEQKDSALAQLEETLGDY
ncbi:MAG: transketolase [Cyclobacteriaceae bacterium]